MQISPIFNRPIDYGVIIDTFKMLCHGTRILPSTCMKLLRPFVRLAQVLVSGPGHSRYGSLKIKDMLAQTMIVQVLRKFGPDLEQQLLQRCGYEYTEEYGQWQAY